MYDSNQQKLNIKQNRLTFKLKQLIKTDQIIWRAKVKKWGTEWHKSTDKYYIEN